MIVINRLEYYLIEYLGLKYYIILYFYVEF